MGPIGLIFRAALSFVHAVLAYGTVLGVHILLSVIVYGDYRHGLFGRFGWLPLYCGAVGGLAVPWLALLRGRSKNPNG